MLLGLPNLPIWSLLLWLLACSCLFLRRAWCKIVFLSSSLFPVPAWLMILSLSQICCFLVDFVWHCLLLITLLWNEYAICIASNVVYHHKMRHIEIYFDYVNSIYALSTFFLKSIWWTRRSFRKRNITYCFGLSGKLSQSMILHEFRMT